MKAHLEKLDPSKNIARYYRISVLPNLFGEWTLHREWGRIGRGGQVRMDLFRSQVEAEGALDTLIHAKQKRKYEKV
ncbi:hypothetical protein DC366_18325 [Pelagivirga sediminicola]|uniref:WGR domain-containing protein n=1 Tax=Pelagivirga sediminicola TaxID=2170575 RepID=A0A2T7G2G9_9RHOB|nr:WGR domain-containing protein [Pelagivirga sediminicola]PVA08598.1 hypothetical protein DC366_18325 [Pelagivirga sediminicola]